MKASMTSNAGAVALKLRNVAQKVPANGRKVMHSSSKTIVKEAKINCPRDDAELEDSIHIEKEYGERGRLQIDIVAGGEVRGVDVDAYAALIHEDYESMRPGPNTILKRAAHPDHIVGGKFLTRAADAEEPKLQKAMIASVLETAKEEGLETEK